MASGRKTTSSKTTSSGTKTPATKASRGRKRERAHSSRLWLMYPPKLITKPVIWQLGQKFRMVTNVRQASVTGEIGIVCLELEGDRAEIDAAIKWLERQGIRVEPVEINVIDS